MKRLYTDFSKFLYEAIKYVSSDVADDFIQHIISNKKAFLWETYFAEEQGPDRVRRGVDIGNTGDFLTCVKEVKKYADRQQKYYEHLVGGGDVMGMIHLDNFIVDVDYHGDHIFVLYNPKKNKWSVTIDSFIIDFL